MAGQIRLDANLVSLRRIVQRTHGQLKSWKCLLLLIAGLVGSLSLPARSQEFLETPDAPSFNKKLFIAEVSAYTTVNVLDGITTAQSIRRGNVEGGFPQGSSFLLGQRPSVVRYPLQWDCWKPVSRLLRIGCNTGKRSGSDSSVTG